MGIVLTGVSLSDGLDGHAGTPAMEDWAGHGALSGRAMAGALVLLGLRVTISQMGKQAWIAAVKVARQNSVSAGLVSYYLVH